MNDEENEAQVTAPTEPSERAIEQAARILAGAYARIAAESRHRSPGT